MRKIKDNQFKLGIILSCALIFLYNAQALISIFHLGYLDQSIVKEIIYAALYFAFQIPLFLLLRKMLLKFEQISRNIILLIIIDSTSTIILLIDEFASSVTILSLLAPLSMIVIYFVFLIGILNKKYNSNTEVVLLRPFAVSFLIVLILSITAAVVLVIYDEDIGKAFTFLISCMPYIFLIGYFMKLRKWQEKLEAEGGSKHWLEE